MIATARAKAGGGPGPAAVEFVHGTVERIADTWSARGRAVDGVFSNFAPAELRAVAGAAAAAARTLVATGRSPHRGRAAQFCPLEVALFMARAQPRAALRRFRRAAIADVEGQRFAMKYYGATDFDRALGTGFQRIETRSLGPVPAAARLRQRLRARPRPADGARRAGGSRERPARPAPHGRPRSAGVRAPLSNCASEDGLAMLTSSSTSAGLVATCGAPVRGRVAARRCDACRAAVRRSLRAGRLRVLPFWRGAHPAAPRPGVRLPDLFWPRWPSSGGRGGAAAADGR